MLVKIIKTLAIVVGAVIVAVFALTILLPNTTTALVSMFEKAIFSSVGIELDLDGNGSAGGNQNVQMKSSDQVKGIGQDLGVTGFEGLSD